MGLLGETSGEDLDGKMIRKSLRIVIDWRDVVTIRTFPSPLAHEYRGFRHSSVEEIFPSACDPGAGFGFLEDEVFGLHNGGLVFSLVPDANDIALDYEVSVST